MPPNLTMLQQITEQSKTFNMCVHSSLKNLMHENISYDPGEPSHDYFQGLMFSNNWITISSLVLLFAGILIIVSGFMGIIWYEKYGNHRIR